MRRRKTTREKETRQNIETYQERYLLQNLESYLLAEIAISLAIIADILIEHKGEQE